MIKREKNRKKKAEAKVIIDDPIPPDNPKMIGPPFILYDGRALATGDTDEAEIMDLADTEAEARKAGKTTWKGYDAVWVQSKLIRERPDGTQEFESRFRYDLPPCSSPFRAGPTFKEERRRSR